MCGITGILNYKSSSPVDRAKLRQATDLLTHRGPDGDGFYFDDTSGLAFGHRRLSIIDLANGDQPMCNEDKTVWITYNGEIYNHKDLRSELIQKGHDFKTNCDTEVIIHAYEEYGEDCPKYFNGIFAFAIWDSKKKNLFLARDHFGVKPLYFSDDGSKFIFASELKAILPFLDSKPSLNPHALNLCLKFRHTPAPYTLLKGIEKIPAAHTVTKKYNHCYELKSFWDKKIVINYDKKEQDWISELRSKISDSVKRQMMSDVPIGISLSGGIDSGCILSLMRKFSNSSLHAYTIAFEGNRKEDDELFLAEKNAKRFGANFNYKLVAEKDYTSFLEKYLWHLEEPIGNESAIAYYFVADMAKGKVKVLLNGQGSDEPFAGYDRHIISYYAEKYPMALPLMQSIFSLIPLNPGRKAQLKRLKEYIAQDNNINRITSAAYIITVEEQNYLFKKELKNISYNNPSFIEISKILNGFSGGNTVEQMIFYDMFSSLSENLLLCEDKMAMAASIEARVPFLDIDFAEAVLNIPSSLKIRGSTGKYIHKKMSEAFLPADVIYQRKIGFNNPVDRWLKKSLGQQMLDLVYSKNSISREYLDIEYIYKIFNEHKSGKVDHQRFLFLLLSIENWATLFLTR